ncbi:MAG: PAS domain S-box protein [Burkholderiales bacterium]|nr:PAS domain S-box protein [Burkholderiales bacterium]
MKTTISRRQLQQLTLGFVFVLTLMAAIVGVAIFGLDLLSQDLKKIVVGHSVHNKLASEMRQLSRERATLLGRIVLENDPFARDDLTQQFTNLGRRFGTARTQLRASNEVLVKAEQDLLKKQQLLVVQLLPMQMRVLDLMVEERSDEAANLLLREVIPLQEQVIETLRQFVEFQEGQTVATAQHAQQTKARVNLLLLLSGALALLVGGGIAVVVSQRIRLLIGSIGQREHESRTLLENIPALVWFKDRQENFIWANPTFLQAADIEPDKITALQDAAVWLASEVAQLKSDDQAAIQSGKTVRLEKTLTLRGQAGRYETSHTPVYDQTGQCVGVLCVAHDVSEQRRIELESRAMLRELEFQKFAMDQHAIVSIADALGRITYANEKFCEVSGYSRETLIHENHSLLKSGKHTDAFYADMWLTLTSGKVWKGEVCNRNKHGDLFWVGTTIVPFLDDNGLPYQYISIRTDITQLKNAEAALQHGKEELERLVAVRTSELNEQLHFTTELMEVLPTPLFFKDIAGNYLGVNKAWEDYFGIPREAIIGKSLEVLYPHAQAVSAVHRAKDQELWHRLGAQSYEISIPIAGGEVRDALYYKATFTKADGSVAGLVGSIVDFTERKQAEVELKQRYEEVRMLNDQLNEAQNQLMQSEKMASVGQLAAGVAHEINNPVGYVYSNLGTLEKYVQDLFGLIATYEKIEPAIADETLLAQVRAAKESVELNFLRDDVHALMGETREGIIRVKKIVQDLKDFSRIDATDEWHWADLQKGIDSTLNIVWNELKYKAEVKKEYADIPEVECRVSQLNQVFMNLLVNAGHAIEDKGVITVRTGLEGDQVWVEIMDSGKGISPENLTRIFDPFFTTKPIGQGTGLGLSLSYGIVQKHGGRIEVQSKLGKGTAFKVWLPISQRDLADVETAHG